MQKFFKMEITELHGIKVKTQKNAVECDDMIIIYSTVFTSFSPFIVSIFI